MVDYSRFHAVAAESDSDDDEVGPATERCISFKVFPRSSSSNSSLLSERCSYDESDESS